jgi:hypothetical protein
MNSLPRASSQVPSSSSLDTNYRRLLLLGHRSDGEAPAHLVGNGHTIPVDFQTLPKYVHIILEEQVRDSSSDLLDTLRGTKSSIVITQSPQSFGQLALRLD